MTTATPIEVKMIAYRKSAKDGYIVSFAIHPNERHDHLSAAPIGARFMAALVEIGDDEQPKGGEADTNRSTQQNASGQERNKTPPPSSSTTAAGARAYSLPQRVAMVCGEPLFHQFINSRADWMFINDGSKNSLIAYIREYCGVDSRSEILPGTEAAKKWEELSARYEGWKRGIE